MSLLLILICSILTFRWELSWSSSPKPWQLLEPNRELFQRKSTGIIILWRSIPSQVPNGPFRFTIQTQQTISSKLDCMTVAVIFTFMDSSCMDLQINARRAEVVEHAMYPQLTNALNASKTLYPQPLQTVFAAARNPIHKCLGYAILFHMVVLWPQDFPISQSSVISVMSPKDW